MNRLEKTAISIFISLACAVSLLVAGWWISASLNIYHLLPISERGIKIAALAGLGLGIILDLLCLRSWVARFYEVNWRLATMIYLYWVMIATAWFMGLPLGTFILGILAGLYSGRRHSHAGTSTINLARQVRLGSLLIALITGFASLGIGILALGEAQVLAVIQRALGTSPGAVTKVAGLAIVLVSCLVLVAFQYWCTRKAAIMAFRWGNVHAT